MQHSLANAVSMQGIGLHSGKPVTLKMLPAAAGRGISFVRTDVKGRDNIIPAKWDCVTDTRLCTVISNKAGVSVGTIEHLMSALRGCAVDNAMIELDGPEVPVMDGSAAPFIEKIDEAGLLPQSQPRHVIEILKEVRVRQDGKEASLTPFHGFAFSGKIDFAHPHIGNQSYEIQLINGNFRHDIAGARTFGFLHEVRFMREQGLALGGSMDNAIVLDEEKVLNREGLRFEDEFIRHKLLDAVGDLYLAGAPIMGLYEGVRAGHAINSELLHALFADKEAFRYTTLDRAAFPLESAGYQETAPIRASGRA